ALDDVVGRAREQAAAVRRQGDAFVRVFGAGQLPAARRVPHAGVTVAAVLPVFVALVVDAAGDEPAVGRNGQPGDRPREQERLPQPAGRPVADVDGAALVPGDERRAVGGQGQRLDRRLVAVAGE